MATRAVQGQRGLFEGPLLFRRARRVVAELVGFVWLAGEVARFIRTR